MTKIDLRKEAKGRPCMVQVPGVCNNSPETTVLAHLNVPGLNVKAHDLHGAWACSNCHAWLDYGWALASKFGHSVSRTERDFYHYEAIIRTQQHLIKEGKL